MALIEGHHCYSLKSKDLTKYNKKKLFQFDFALNDAGYSYFECTCLCLVELYYKELFCEINLEFSGPVNS